MAMSVFMLYIVLKKNIDNDRVLIGTMKAMGMKNIELNTKYLPASTTVSTKHNAQTYKNLSRLGGLYSVGLINMPSYCYSTCSALL